MPISLDKLKAIIRLANNNPNENEANLAARRACKLLAENDFALLNGHTVPPKASNWSGVDRSQEPFWEPGDPFYDFFVNQGNPFRGGQRGGKQGQYRPSEKQKEYWTDSAPHVDAPEDNDYQPFYKPPRRNPQEDFDWITGKRKRKQELRVCSKCGLETMTFRTDEVPWICNPCHWKEGKT